MNKAETMHFGIAEQGKVYALKGQHDDALRYYREALRLAMSAKSAEVFFRHYTQCVMESLELTGAYEGVVQYCQEADKHYQTLHLDDDLHKKDHAAILERYALMLLQQTQKDEAKAMFEQAIKRAGKGVLPLSESILNWLQRGLNVGTQQLRAAQRRHNYFVVRKALVNPALAIHLPEHSSSPLAM